MKKYTIEWCENREIKSLNKTVLNCSLKDEEGHVTEKVTLWPDAWVLSNYRAGSTITGKLVEKVNGNFTNRSLEPEKTNTLPRKASTPIAQAMKTKADNIEQAQERKSDAIRLAGTARDATLLTVEWMRASSAGLTLDESAIKAEWQKWRKWLTTEFGDEGSPF